MIELKSLKTTYAESFWYSADIPVLREGRIYSVTTNWPLCDVSTETSYMISETKDKGLLSIVTKKELCEIFGEKEVFKAILKGKIQK